jgi:hypothetical protein
MNYNNNNNKNNNIDHSDSHDDNHTISMNGKTASNTTTTTYNDDDDVSKVNINKVLCHLPTAAKYVLLKDILGSEDYNGKLMIVIIIIIIIHCMKDNGLNHTLFKRLWSY